MERKELPKGWEWKRLEDIADINSRFEKNSFDDEMKVTYLPMRCVEELTGKTDTSLEKRYGELRTGYTPIQNGDLLFAKITPCIENGKIAIVQNLKNGIGFASTEFHTMKFSKENDTRFFFFYLMQEKIRQTAARNMTGTAGQLRVPVTFLKRLNVPVPPLAVQRQIVAVLEQAVALKRQRQEADALTGALLQSVFYEMFGDPVRNEMGWKVMALHELSSHIIDCPHSTPEYEEGITPYPCIRTTELKDGYIDWTQMKYLNEKNYLERINRLTPSEGDIVFGREGSFGVAVRVPKNVKLCLGQRVMLFRPDPKYCNSEFLWALLNSDAILRQANSKTSGSTVAHINVTDIKKFGGICPPLALQQQFARIVENVERIRGRQVESGKEIEALCGGLMQRAFRGELVC